MIEKCEGKNCGITLIALVITIIVLLILAGVSVSMLSGNNGVLQKATEAKQANKDAENLEKIQTAVQAVLIDSNNSGKITDFSVGEKLSKEIETEIGENKYKGNGIVKIDDNNKYIILSDGSVYKTVDVETAKVTSNDNMYVLDEYENLIVVPAGFKITDNANNVPQGIVIEDVSANDDTSKGNQFVWVPVGEIYTDEARTELNKKTITLSRYTFDSGTQTDKEDTLIDDHYQELEISKYGNETAKSIGEFKTSAKTRHGYYIGRYEAGKSDTNLICKAGVDAWNTIVQPEASKVAKAMYNSTKFASDLINSYAWDTAIIFEQTFGKNQSYSMKTSDYELCTTGKSTDVQCNIYDMAGNLFEWSTETSNILYNQSCVYRGDFYYMPGEGRTCYRGVYDNTIADNYIGFRPILYLR